MGAAARARLIAQFLDKDPAPVSYTSSRGFETITGYFKGTQVSIVSIGMVNNVILMLYSSYWLLILVVYAAGSCDDGFLCSRDPRSCPGADGHH